jgi:hypothetical protein
MQFILSGKPVKNENVFVKRRNRSKFREVSGINL